MAGPTYAVARGFYNNEWIPGKLHTIDLRAFISTGGNEI